MRAQRTPDAIRQNLLDAGCDESTIKRFMKCLTESRTADGLKLLAEHRRALLDSLHKEQKCIDHLDYLVYEMEKAKPSKQTK